MEQIWQIVLAIIASIGGAGIIILGVVKFASDMIAERLSKRYEIKLNKELEAFKAGINKKTYISRARFDTEFQIYRELSESVLSMIECTYWLFPSGLEHLPSDKEEEKKIYIERYNKAGDAIRLAQKSIRANAPFIPSGFYARFEELSKLCSQQYNMFTWCGALAPRQDVFPKTKVDAETACWKRTDEIWEKRTELTVQLREYLESLDVLEDK